MHRLIVDGYPERIMEECDPKTQYKPKTVEIR
jgi:hypothetical protein